MGSENLTLFAFIYDTLIIPGGAPALGGAGGRVLHRNWPRGDALLNTGKWKWVFVETNSLNATLGISKDYTLTSRLVLCTA